MIKFATILALVVVSSVFSMPRNKRDIFSSIEDEFFPVRRRSSIPSAFDVDRFWDDDWPFSSGVTYRNPFRKAFNQMENTIRSMQNEINRLHKAAMGSFASDAAGTPTGAPAPSGATPSGVATSVRFPQGFDPSRYQNKTESKVEVVDGRIVETNETVYSSGDRNHGQVYRFKSVYVRPQNPPTEQSGPATQQGSAAANTETINPHRREEMDANDVNKKVSNDNDLEA